jgi:hypothetical protein
MRYAEELSFDEIIKPQEKAMLCPNASRVEKTENDRSKTPKIAS